MSVVPAPARSLADRFRDVFADPVLQILATATLVSTLGRGVFLTLTALYFTLIVGLTTTQVALVLAVASTVGVGTSLLGGHLADRFSARRVLLVLVFVNGAALLTYAEARTFVQVMVVACVVVGSQSAANATRSAVIARAFTGPDRVSTRAWLRTVTNVGIAVGSAAAGIPLLIGTGGAFRVTIVLAACATIASCVPLARLPRRVDAPRRRVDGGGVGGVGIGVGVGVAGVGGGVGVDGAGVGVDSSKAVRASRPGRSPFRNPAYLTLTALSGLFGIQFALAEVGLPLWIVRDTKAPVILVSVVLIVNTLLVIALQVPLSRRTNTARRSGDAVGIAGILMLGACVLYGSSGSVTAVIAVALILVGTLLHTFAEILSSAGTWNLSFDMANQDRAGAYQGVFGMGFSLGSLFGPLIVAATALAHGFAGWVVLALVFAAAAAGIVVLARRAAVRLPVR